MPTTPWPKPNPEEMVGLVRLMDREGRKALAPLINSPSKNVAEMVLPEFKDQIKRHLKLTTLDARTREAFEGWAGRNGLQRRGHEPAIYKVEVRFTANEMKAIKAAASQLGSRTASYVRYAAVARAAEVLGKEH